MTTTADPVSRLFEPVRLGALSLPNRIVMAPMTRSRADDQGRVGALSATYYGQRAGAGLIVSEGVFPVWMGKGYIRTPGLVTEEHARGWRAVTDEVHGKGGLIVAQLMHAGRISDPLFLPGGAPPVAPSAVRAAGSAYTDQGLRPHPTPRALEVPEIREVLAGYARSARLALDAGFDAVELHAASGYLPEQFLTSGTNRRDDAYGGTPERRRRFVLEALEALIAAAGADRVGIKLAPELGFNDITDEAPRETYAGLVEAIAGHGLAYLHVAAPGAQRSYHALLRPLFRGPYMAGGGLDRESGADLLARGAADAISYGTPFIANPDLPVRFRRGAALATSDRGTWYTPGPRGYIDYPALASEPAERRVACPTSA